MSIPSQLRKSWHPGVQTNHQQITNERRKKDFYSHQSDSQTKTTREGAGSDALCLALFWNPLLRELASCLPANRQAASVLKEFSDTFLCCAFIKKICGHRVEENTATKRKIKFNRRKSDSGGNSAVQNLGGKDLKTALEKMSMQKTTKRGKEMNR